MLSDMGGPPKVSVIIATYNRSCVLRWAIESVLRQTFRDFELLVVGDACNDDSERVASSFGDPRIRWSNLPSNSGSQHGPNNYGIQAAAGEYIAYLGCDDIWYPTHLESLIRTIERTQADMAGGVAILYGPPYSGVRGVSGIFEGADFGKHDFMVPSSIMHRRTLVNQIGLWREPADMALPPDCEFERRAFEAGARIVSSGEVTVFKFNAAWRRNSYITANDDEQREIMAKIHTGQDFRQAELIDAMRAFLEGRYVRIKAPSERDYGIGEIMRHSRRYKGFQREVEYAALEPLRATTRFGLQDQFQGFEWHQLETHDPEPFRWSGPSRLSTAEFPFWCDRAVLVTACVVNHFQDDLAEDVKLIINGQEVQHIVKSDGAGHAILQALAPAQSALIQGDRRPFYVSFFVKKTCRPADLGINDDARWLGLAVGWLEFAPISDYVGH